MLRTATTGIAALLAVISARSAAAADCPDLLAHERPAWSARVADPEALTDGLGGAAARFDAPFATAVWDLGVPRPVRSLSLLTRGEGVFEVAASDDGVAWRPLWQAQSGEVSNALHAEVDDRARWLRLDLVRAPGDAGFVAELRAGCDARELPAPADAPTRAGLSPRLRAVVPVAAVLLLALGSALVARQRRVTLPFDPSSRAWSLAVAGLLALAALFAVFGFRGAGFNVDEYFNETYARELIDWYRLLASGRYVPFQSSLIAMNFYGGFFELWAEGISRLSPLPHTETRHLVTALFGSLAYLGAFLLGRQLGGPAAGFIAALALLATPIFTGQLFVNPKDVPFAVCHVFVLVTLVACLRRLPRVPWLWSAALGGSVGAAVGMRVGGAIVIAYLALGLLAWIVAERGRGGRIGREEVRELVRVSSRVALIALLVVMLSWPWLWTAGVMGPIQAVRHFRDTATSYGIEFTVLFEGNPIPYSRLPRRYTIEWLMLVLPEFYWLAAPALAVVLAYPRRPRNPESGATRWIGLALVAASVVLPMALTLARAVSQFDGLRHFLFVLPPLAVLLGVTLASALARATAGLRLGLAVAGAALVALAVWDAARLHPYEYVYFNRIIGGGLPVASPRYETDNLGLSHEAAVAWLLEHHSERPEQPIRVTSCPGFTINVRKPLREAGALSDRFAFTAESRDADIAIASPRSDCFKRYRGRLLAAIQREGVPLMYVIDQRQMRAAAANDR